ncbi:MAG: PAS domain S-box protein [Bacteroidota bacterium]|nr:PAS domain S-box protein [Bacteroidota bacterium]
MKHLISEELIQLSKLKNFGLVLIQLNTQIIALTENCEERLHLSEHLLLDTILAEESANTLKKFINSKPGTIQGQSIAATTRSGNIIYITCISCSTEQALILLKIDFSKKETDSFFYLESLLSNLGIIFYAIDTDFALLTKNFSFDQLFKNYFKIVPNIGDNLFEFIKDNEAVAETFLQYTNKCLAGEYAVESVNFKSLSFSFSMSPIKYDNEIRGVAVLVMDKSKEEKLLEKLFRTNTNMVSIINSTDELIYALDREYKFLVFNDAYKELYTSIFKTEPKIGETTAHAQSDSPISVALKKWYQLAMEGESMHFETDIYNTFADVKLNPIKNTKGDILGISIYSRDISSIKESERKLAESEKQYKYVLDSVNDIIFQTDNAGNWIFLNRSWLKVMEYSVEETIGKPFFNYLHPDDVQKNYELFLPLIEGKKNYCNHEIRYVTKSGRIKWIRVYATLTHDDFGQATGTAGTLQDITKEKETLELYQLVSNNIADIICLHSLDSIYEYVSPSIVYTLGYEPYELIGKSPFEFVHSDDRKDLMFNLERENEELLIYRFKNKKGYFHWLETSRKTINDSTGKPVSILTSSRIIDTRIEAEQKMHQALEKEKKLNTLKSRFVSMASHEFKNPLAAIKSSTELLNRYLSKATIANAEQFNKHLHTINEEIDRMTFLINDILLLEKVESSAFVINKQETDIVTAIQKIADRQNGMQSDGRRINVSIINAPRNVMIDEAKVIHVLDNLISNAFKYSVGRLSPELSIQFDATKVKIEIRDHGIGIPNDEHDKLFNSFFRARNVNNIEGTGLGLVIAKNFIDFHGGNIYFSSEENRGTSFAITLPYA